MYSSIVLVRKNFFLNFWKIPYIYKKSWQDTHPWGMPADDTYLDILVTFPFSSCSELVMHTDRLSQTESHTVSVNIAQNTRLLKWRFSSKIRRQKRTKYHPQYRAKLTRHLGAFRDFGRMEWEENRLASALSKLWVGVFVFAVRTLANKLNDPRQVGAADLAHERLMLDHMLLLETVINHLIDRLGTGNYFVLPNSPRQLE